MPGTFFFFVLIKLKGFVNMLLLLLFLIWLSILIFNFYGKCASNKLNQLQNTKNGMHDYD